MEELLELSCDTCDTYNDLTLEEKSEKFEEALKTEEKRNMKNINGENFLHLLLWETGESIQKEKMLKIFLKNNNITKENKKNLFFVKNEDGEAPIDYLIESIDNKNKMKGKIIENIFEIFTIEEKINILKVLKEDNEIFANTIANENEKAFLNIILSNITEEEMKRNQEEILEILLHPDEDGETVFETITEEKPLNLTKEEIIAKIEKEYEHNLKTKKNNKNKIKRNKI